MFVSPSHPTHSNRRDPKDFFPILSCKNIFFTIINLLYMFHLMLVLNEYKQNNPEYRSGVIYIFHSSPRFTVSATINFFRVMTGDRRSFHRDHLTRKSRWFAAIRPRESRWKFTCDLKILLRFFPLMKYIVRIFFIAEQITLLCKHYKKSSKMSYNSIKSEQRLLNC